MKDDEIVPSAMDVDTAQPIVQLRRSGGHTVMAYILWPIVQLRWSGGHTVMAYIVMAYIIMADRTASTERAPL